MAEIETNGKALPALYVPQGRPITRTKNPARPDWLDRIRRPLLIVAKHERQFADFKKTWKLDDTECARILLVNDIKNVTPTHPLLVLPDGEDGEMIFDFCPVKFWREKGNPVIELPPCTVRAQKRELGIIFAHFPIEVNMQAETVIAIAQHRHLDALNGKP